MSPSQKHQFCDPAPQCAWISVSCPTSVVCTCTLSFARVKPRLREKQTWGKQTRHYFCRVAPDLHTNAFHKESSHDEAQNRPKLKIVRSFPPPPKPPFPRRPRVHLEPSVAAPPRMGPGSAWPTTWLALRNPIPFACTGMRKVERYSLRPRRQGRADVGRISREPQKSRRAARAVGRGRSGSNSSGCRPAGVKRGSGSGWVGFRFYEAERRANPPKLPP